MAILKIITVSDDSKGILRQVAKPISPKEIPYYQGLINDMLETILHVNAVGLAASQVGYTIQLFVLEDGVVCINPGSIMGGGKITSRDEGCLSLPGERYKTKRIRNVMVRCLDRNGQPQLLKPHKKLYNVAIQHEIDHLNGKLLCDKGIKRL